MMLCIKTIFVLGLLSMQSTVFGQNYDTNPFLNGYVNDVNAFLSDRKHENDVNLKDNIYINHEINSRAAKFSGPEYLPPTEILRCNGKEVCVLQSLCQNGYFVSKDLSQSVKKDCDSKKETCCLYKEPVKPSTPCLETNFACVSANQCLNGQITLLNFKKSTGAPNHCSNSEVCCRIPLTTSTILTDDGYHLRKPDRPMILPERPIQIKPGIELQNPPPLKSVERDYLPPNKVDQTRQPPKPSSYNPLNSKPHISEVKPHFPELTDDGYHLRKPERPMILPESPIQIRPGVQLHNTPPQKSVERDYLPPNNVDQIRQPPRPSSDHPLSTKPYISEDKPHFPELTDDGYHLRKHDRPMIVPERPIRPGFELQKTPPLKSVERDYLPPNKVDQTRQPQPPNPSTHDSFHTKPYTSERHPHFPESRQHEKPQQHVPLQSIPQQADKYSTPKHYETKNLLHPHPDRPGKFEYEPLPHHFQPQSSVPQQSKPHVPERSFENPHQPIIGNLEHFKEDRYQKPDKSYGTPKYQKPNQSIPHQPISQLSHHSIDKQPERPDAGIDESLVPGAGKFYQPELKPKGGVKKPTESGTDYSYEPGFRKPMKTIGDQVKVRTGFEETHSYGETNYKKENFKYQEKITEKPFSSRINQPDKPYEYHQNEIQTPNRPSDGRPHSQDKQNADRPLYPGTNQPAYPLSERTNQPGKENVYKQGPEKPYVPRNEKNYESKFETPGIDRNYPYIPNQHKDKHLNRPFKPSQEKIVIRGDYDLSEEIPASKPIFNNHINEPHVQRKCAAALNCTQIKYCTATGDISNSPVILSQDEEKFRVPLADCFDEEKGFDGKCCRDLTYTDPWPVTQLGQYQGIDFGENGKYKPDQLRNPRTQINQVKRSATGSKSQIVEKIALTSNGSGV